MMIAKTCALLAGAAIFATTVQAADYRIGVVNAAKILEAAPQADAARKALEKEFAPKDHELVAAQKELKKLQDQLAKDSAIMSEANRKRLERKIVNQRRELKRRQDEFRDDLNFRRNEEFSKIQREIVKAIQDIAKEDKYDLVVGEGVIYASDRMNLTGKIIERLKKK